MRTLCKDPATTTKQSEEAIASQFRAMESKIETRFQRAQTTLRSEQVRGQTIGTFCACCVLPYLPPSYRLAHCRAVVCMPCDAMVQNADCNQSKAAAQAVT